MSSIPIVTPMNLSQYARFSSFQQVSHDRRHSNPFSDGSPALGESPLPLEPLDLHSSPARPFAYLTNTAQATYNPYVQPSNLNQPTSAPAHAATFQIADPSAPETPPQQYTPLAGTTLRPIPEAWPGLRPHHRSQSWAAPPPPHVDTSPPNPFSSPGMVYATPVHRPMSIRGGTDGYEAVAYATYPYPGQEEWEVPRSVPARRPSREGSQSPEKTIRRHICPVCDKAFSRPSSLQTHMSVHTGAKPFICPRHDCGRRFSVSSNLRRHERTHTPRGFSDSGFHPTGVQYHPYAQPVLGAPFIAATNMPLEWQSAPLSSGLGHYSISRPNTRHGGPTTPETPPVIALNGMEDDIEAASKSFQPQAIM